MPNEAGGARLYRLLETIGAPVLLGERREGNGRRVRLDPAFQFFNARRVRHRVTGYCTATVFVTRPVFPALSVTVRVTLKLAAPAYAWDGDASVLLLPSPKSQK